MVSELLTHSPVKISILVCVQSLYLVSFAFSLTNSTHFQSSQQLPLRWVEGIGQAGGAITGHFLELTMNCDIFRVLDKGISSGHLNRDGIGSLCKECEGNAAVQGDEGLKKSGKANLILRGI